MTQEITQLVKPSIVELPVSVDKLKEKADQFKELKSKLLTENDFVKIGENRYIKKSGILQFALAFNLTTEIIKEEKETNEKKPEWYAYHFTVRCSAPNGRKTEKTGSCSSDEGDKDGKPLHKTVHKIRTMAETRANNRAISAMVGSSEATAEEMAGTHSPQNSIVFCKCTEGPQTMQDGFCKRCNHISETYWKSHN